MTVIDLDTVTSPAEAESSRDRRRYEYVRVWCARRPATAGALVACGIAAVTGLVGAAAVAARPAPPEKIIAAYTPPPREVKLLASGDGQVARVMLYREPSGKLVRFTSTGEVLGPDPLVVTDGPVGVIISVAAAPGWPTSCSVTVDGRVVASDVNPAGSQSICAWLPDPGTLVVTR